MVFTGAISHIHVHVYQSCVYSVSPRINEKGGGGYSGCTEYEIVSGGLVHVHTPFIV